ncbi:MgtC/SapB family protein, partial [archaeon]|nr:MgtC/SapB family protein [archaeon]
MTAEIEFIKMLVISALVGGLIGVERELKDKVVVGMRTFMLTSMFGALSVWISTSSGEGQFLTVAFLGMILIAVLVTFIKNMSLWDIGITTSVAFLLTFILGVMVGFGMYFEGVAGGI